MNALLRNGIVLGAAVMLGVFATPLQAQIPGAPAAPAVPGAPAAPGIPAAPAAVPAAAPAQPTSLWSFLGITPENCEKCRAKLCSKPIGQMLNNMLMPMQFATGGLIHPLCPPPSADDLKKLLDPNNLNVSPEEALAAKIKADEAAAKARIAALRYLATVDCHYYPEAGDAIIDAMRKDRNECVRYEAALALNRGCCCNKKTIAALILVVSGQDTDGNPSETSQRVKSAAMSAMNLCMGSVSYFPAEPVRPEVPPELQPPEAPPAAAAGFPHVQLTAFYTEYLPTVPRDKLIQLAGRILAEAAGSAPPMPASSTKGGLMQMWQDSQDIVPMREEISFDEAALATPLRSPALAPSPAVPTPTSNSGNKAPAPASDKAATPASGKSAPSAAAPQAAGPPAETRLGYSALETASARPAPDTTINEHFAPSASVPPLPKDTGAVPPPSKGTGVAPRTNSTTAAEPVAWPIKGDAAASSPAVGKVDVPPATPQMDPVPWPVTAGAVVVANAPPPPPTQSVIAPRVPASVSPSQPVDVRPAPLPAPPAQSVLSSSAAAAPPFGSALPPFEPWVSSCPPQQSCQPVKAGVCPCPPPLPCQPLVSSSVCECPAPDCQSPCAKICLMPVDTVEPSLAASANRDPVTAQGFRPALFAKRPPFGDGSELPQHVPAPEPAPRVNLSAPTVVYPAGSACP